MHDTDLRAQRDALPEARPNRAVSVLLALAAAVVVSVVATWLWSTATEREPRLAAPEEQVPAPPQPAPAAAQAAASAPPLYPMAADNQALELHEIPGALEGLLGAKATATFVQSDDFPRRFAATVDSMARAASSPAAWPVLPTPGRFQVEERPDGPVIAPSNAARYTPVVLLAGTIDVPAAVRLYRRMYPLLQQAHRALGFGDRYLNDRVVQVIDVLLATPDVPEAPRVELLAVRGQVPSLQPWVRWQFVDPQLEALSAGQKILVRIGPVNRGRLQSKLAELRKELTGPAPAVAAAVAAAAPAVAASTPPAPAPSASTPPPSRPR